jgi:membrane peptidoglycan carboxypeptidase
MTSISRILRIRQKRQSREKRSPLGRIGLGCSAVFSLVLLPLVFAALAGYASLTRDLPSLETLPALLNPPDGSLLQPTRIYDRSGTHLILALEDPAAAGREYLSLEDLPQDLVDAYLAVFEPDFWESPGYTLHGMAESTQQSPTGQPLAQQLASDLLLWQEPASLRRTLRERLLAAQLISHFGHEQVLEWNLNSAQFGPLIYGVDAAARVYFGKSAAELNLAESTFLVAAALSPETSPLEVPQVVMQQQKTVLEQMLVHERITSTQLAQTSLSTPTLQDPIPPNNPAPALTNLVLEQLSASVPLDRLLRGGLRVISSLDYDLQIQALCTSAIHEARLRGEESPENTIDGQPCEAARLLPTLPVDRQASAGGLTSNAVILDPATGQILAMVGDPVPGEDPAHQPGHPAGSLLTPFVYLTGFTRGLSPASLVWDLPSSQPLTAESEAEPDLSVYRGPLRLRTALANDYLAPARQLVQQLGSDTILRLTQELGLDSLASLPSGTDSVFDQPVLLLDIAHSYSIFANQGTLAGQSLSAGETNPGQDSSSASLEPAAVIRLQDEYGNTWLDWSEPEKQAILAPQLAYIMADVLSDETARWPTLGHPNALEIGRPAAAKLGLSTDGSSAWSLGFTPQRLIAVWVGYPQNTQAPVNTAMPAAFWHALMQYSHRQLPSQDWQIPPGLSSVAVCDPSGMLPTENCPNVVDEIFLTGSEPVQPDNLYQVFQVNRETGQLATVFTPPEMVEERVYLVVPPDAVEWARKTGVPIPPDSYDAIYVAPPASPDVRIDSPPMFSHVSGLVTITGTASGEGFDFYRLQAGQGLNPQTWLQITEDIQEPVVDGTLGTWQTAGLSGLYTLQLLVVRQDQSIEKAILQVTIDNTPPQLTLLRPLDEQQVKISAGSKVLLQAEASDDVELARLEFYIDERLVATLVEAPFNVLWSGQPGEHTMQVIAYDLAGNSTQDQLDFELVQ